MMIIQRDLTTWWLRIALDHLGVCGNARRSVLVGLDANDGTHNEPLVQELVSGMQCVMASAFAVDAYYANVKRNMVRLPEVNQDTARYKNVAEHFRMAFRWSRDEFADERTKLGGLYKLRDKAVHPSAAEREAIRYPGADNLAVEWRHVAFGFDEAHKSLGYAIGVIERTAEWAAENAAGDIQSYGRRVCSNMAPALERWNDEFSEE